MFILKRWVNFTKDVFLKPLKIVFLSILFLIVVIFIKYKPVYSVTVSGKTLGYVKEKSNFEKQVNEYINNRDGSVVLIDIENMPKYSFALVSRDEVTQEKEILEKIESTAVVTYRAYAITVNGETVKEVGTEIEAENIVSNLKSDLKEGVQFELGISELYKTDANVVSEESALTELNEIKLAKTTEYEQEQARLEAERLEAERLEAERLEAERLEAERLAEEEKQAKLKAEAAAAQSKAPTTQIASSVGSGNVNGMSIQSPLRVGYSISSRFGEVSRIRSGAHTGLDLAVALGTPIYPIANGTVTFAGVQGSYGKLVVVDHGNGIQSWYGHCNSLNVGVGAEVTPNTNIATVGNTGNSTGPHLHLEIRINGSAVNPQSYLH
ncbi:MAG: M23 family metallopeptidase [Clostridia bacterium]|nr:M23 family metallopeptidase [Clostridia bacterium]